MQNKTAMITLAVSEQIRRNELSYSHHGRRLKDNSGSGFHSSEAFTEFAKTNSQTKVNRDEEKKSHRPSELGGGN